MAFLAQLFDTYGIFINKPIQINGPEPTFCDIMKTDSDKLLLVYIPLREYICRFFTSNSRLW